MITENEELLTPRDFIRAAAGHLDRLESGEVDKLVLMRSGKMRFVVLRVEDYEGVEALHNSMVRAGRT